MDKEELKQSLKPSDIERVLKYFNVDFFYNKQEALQIETACHNRHSGSHKLYYYPESCTFHCYTDCGESFDVYDLIMKVSETRGESINFSEALQTLGTILSINVHKGIKRKKGFGNNSQAINDWDWISKIKRRKVQRPEFAERDENVLNKFKEWYTLEWINEGITVETQEKFGIKFNPDFNQTVIPHRDPDGQLIGVRVRNWRDVEKGKYMPLYHEGESYRHPLGFNLYGLHENKEAIKKNKKAVIVEGEKSVLKAHSMFGRNNFTISLCGSSMNAYQAELLLELGVDEVIICTDKDYHFEPNKEYIDKVRKIAKHFINKANVFHITDTRDVLDYKECMFDASKEKVINIMEFDKHKITEL